MVKISLEESLGLKDSWFVEKIDFNHAALVVDIYISHTGVDLFCPQTGEKGTLYDHRSSRSWCHLDWFEYKCFLHCRVPRVLCSSGVKTISVPWANVSERMTRKMEVALILYLHSTKNITKTKKHFGCSFRTVQRIMKRSVDYGMSVRSVSVPEHLSIDEKAYKKGHQYATIVSDAQHGYVIDMVEGRDLKSTQSLLKDIVGDQQHQVKTITTDMWKPYIPAAGSELPDSSVNHDRFHLIQYLNKAIDHVGRREVKVDDELKNSRYALLKNKENRTKKQNIIFQLIRDANFEVSKAWRFREDFKALFGSECFDDVQSYLKLWISSVKKSSIKEVMKVAAMFERHFTGVCNALSLEQSNARAEGLNAKIKEVLTIGKGYRHFENLRISVLFFHGQLKLHPQLSD